MPLLEMLHFFIRKDGIKMDMFNVQGYELRKQLLKGKPSCLPKEVEQKPEVKDLKSNKDGIAKEYYGTLDSKKEDLLKEYYEAMSTMNKVELGIIRRDGTIEINEEAKITADTDVESMEKLRKTVDENIDKAKEIFEEPIDTDVESMEKLRKTVDENIDKAKEIFKDYKQKLKPNLKKKNVKW